MKRQAIEGGRWFDVDQAQKWEEDTQSDGSNKISCATGSQWESEALYLTAAGAWVLNHWSQRQGSVETWGIVDADEAARWLIANSHELPEVLNEAAAGLEV